MRTLRADIAVVGGGPAGATAAIGLADAGYRVSLCEKAVFPRDHVGISLSPGVRRQFAFLGLEPLLDDRAHRHDVPIERSWSEPEFRAVPGKFTTIVSRSILDRDLLNAARDRGVNVLQPTSAYGLESTGDRWRISIGDAGTLEADFVVDAAGRATWSRRRRRMGAPTLALCGRWRGSKLDATRVRAQAGFWSWAAPTGPDETALVCFVDPRAFRDAPGSVAARYRELTAKSEMLAGDAVTIIGEPVACDATPYIAADGLPRFLSVGDADQALDPLSSSGVQAAVQSALSAVPVVNTLLSHGCDREAALDFWRMRRRLRSEEHRRRSEASYREAYGRFATPFWASRAGTAGPADRISPQDRPPLPQPDQPLVLSEGTAFVSTPCLIDRMVERRECIYHPDLSEPLAFFEGASAPGLLRSVAWPATAASLVSSWREKLGLAALGFLAWAWRNGIVTNAPPTS